MTHFKNQSWQLYIVEFFSVFIAVIAAFALNNWNENRRDNLAESKILTEIYNGLEKDLEDAKVNGLGHEACIRAADYWTMAFSGEEVDADSLGQNYFLITRDFVSIQNTSGYSTLKSKGLELVRNDSLRSQILALYEFNYQILQKLEEEYEEMQFHKHYFEPLNKVISPHLVFDDTGNIVDVNRITIEKEEQNMLQSLLWKMRVNRRYMVKSYKDVQKQIKDLRETIKLELASTLDNE